MTVPKRVVPPRLLHLITADPAPDADLLSRFIQSRDGVAFAALVERHGPMVLRVCRRMLWDSHTVDDAFQATFLALIRGAWRVRKTASVASWLYGAAVRISLKARGTAARARRTPSQTPNRCDPDPLAEISGRELVSVIDEELARLPDQFRAVITLCCLEGLSQEEAAQRLGWSVASVKGRLERGRERLRLRLAQRGLALPVGLGSILLGEAHAIVPPRLFAQTVELAALGTIPPGVAKLAAGVTASGTMWKAVAVAFVMLAVGGVAALESGNQSPQTSLRPHPEDAMVSAKPIGQVRDSLPEGNIQRVTTDPRAKTDRSGDPLPVGATMRLGTIRTRAPITGFGFGKDGTIVTAGPSVDIRRWNLVDDKSEEPILLPLKGPETSNNYPQVSPDGTLVAACSNEKVFVWETPTDPNAKPKEVAVFEITGIRLFQFAPNSAKLIVATQLERFCTVHVYDIKTGKRTNLECSPRYVEGLAVSGDGKRVGVVGDHDFYLLDAVTGKQLAKYEPNDQMSSEFALNHAGDVMAARIIFSKTKYELRFTDPLTGKKCEGLSGPEGPATWVTFTADGKTLLIGGRHRVRWWDPVAAKLIRTFEGIATETYALQDTPGRFSSDGKTLVAHNGCGLLRWDANTGKPLFPEQDLGHGGYVCGFGFSSDGKRIATSGIDRRVCVWDAITGKDLWHAPTAWAGSQNIDFSPDGKFLYVGGPEWGEVTKFDAESGKVVLKFVTDPKGPKQSSVDCIRVSKDGKTVFGLSDPNSASDPSFVTTWNATTGERTKATPLPVRASYGAELSPGGEYVAIGDPGEGGVFAVGGPKKNLLAEAKLRGFSMVPGQFSDDGNWYIQTRMAQAEGGFNHSVVVVSTLTWGVSCTIPMKANGKVGLSPDGQTLAVAVGEKLEFYDTATARSLGSYRVPVDPWEKAHHSHVNGLRFTPDGRKLITGHIDTTALVWPVPPRPAK